MNNKKKKINNNNKKKQVLSVLADIVYEFCTKYRVLMIFDFQQLLVLVLQIVASIALNTKYHRELIDRDLPNVLNQLLLPSDEWYYTNHSDKYGRYVKHHAARVLVYLGFSYRINISIFDMFQGEEMSRTPCVVRFLNYNMIIVLCY